MRDVAIVSFAQAPLDQPPGMTETHDAVADDHRGARARRARRDATCGFTCSGSADYLTGGTFTFVQMLEAAGAWPPISESHVEMDGAWALYEAWVRLQHGDIDVALVFASGRAGLSVSLRETLTPAARPVLPRAAGRRLRLAVGAAGASGARRATGRTERDLAEVVARSRRDAKGNPNAAVSGDFTVDDLLAKDYVVAPLREHDIARRSTAPPRSCSSPATGRATVRASGVDRGHRPPHRAALPGRARPLDVARRPRSRPSAAGVGNGGVEVAELHRRVSARGADARATRSASATTSRSTRRAARSSANPTMVAGLVRIGEAFRQVSERRQAPRARPRDVGPVPATEPRLRVGGQD